MGVCCVSFILVVLQGKNAEGIRHLERVANLKEPEDAKSKAHYYDAFLVLARYELERSIIGSFFSSYICISIVNEWSFFVFFVLPI